MVRFIDIRTSLVNTEQSGASIIAKLPLNAGWRVPFHPFGIHGALAPILTTNWSPQPLPDGTSTPSRSSSSLGLSAISITRPCHLRICHFQHYRVIFQRLDLNSCKIYFHLELTPLPLTVSNENKLRKVGMTGCKKFDKAIDRRLKSLLKAMTRRMSLL